MPCPTGEGPRLSPSSLGDISIKMEQAIAEYVYGPDRPLALDSSVGILYNGGSMTLTRQGGAILVFAITEVRFWAARAGKGAASGRGC